MRHFLHRLDARSGRHCFSQGPTHTFAEFSALTFTFKLCGMLLLLQPKSCRSTFFLPKPAGLGSLEGPKATPVEAPDRDLLSVLTVQGTPGHSSGHFRKSRERLQKRKSAKSSIGIREAAFLAEEAETTGSQYCEWQTLWTVFTWLPTF